MEGYYVYTFFIDGVPIYVGRGSGRGYNSMPEHIAKWGDVRRNERWFLHLDRPKLPWEQHAAQVWEDGGNIEIKIEKTRFWGDTSYYERELINKYGKRHNGTGTLYNIK